MRPHHHTSAHHHHHHFRQHCQQQTAQRRRPPGDDLIAHSAAASALRHHRGRGVLTLARVKLTGLEMTESLREELHESLSVHLDRSNSKTSTDLLSSDAIDADDDTCCCTVCGSPDAHRQLSSGNGHDESDLSCIAAVGAAEAAIGAAVAALEYLLMPESSMCRRISRACQRSAAGWVKRCCSAFRSSMAPC